MYRDFLSFFEKNKEKVEFGKKDIVQQDWINYIEAELGFPLPNSYKWWSKEFEFFKFNFDYVKFITPPQVRDSADIDILYTYKVNLDNNILNDNQVCIFETEDELYYFDITEGILDNEYKVFIRDYYSDNEDIYADNFLGFLRMKIEEL